MSVRSAMSAVLGGSREIGPIGTASRIVVGLVAVGLPVVRSGIGWWDIVAALVVLPLVTTVVAVVVTAVYERFAPKALARRHSICSGPACWLIAVMVGVTVPLAARTPVNGVVVFWVWLGVSMLLAAALGYGGCEVLAIPNLITGRRDQIGCILYTPIDRAESKRKTDKGSQAFRARR